MTLRVEPLGSQAVEAFSCGNPELDDWLIRHAHGATRHGTRTSVLLDDTDRVVGYFAIAPHLLTRDTAPGALRRGSPAQIPGILLARLALDRSVQGQGLGSQLLLTALRTIIAAARVAGGRVVVVDAIDDAAQRFYEHHDFQPLPHHEHRLVLKLSTAAQALGLPWP